MFEDTVTSVVEDKRRDTAAELVRLALRGLDEGLKQKRAALDALKEANSQTYSLGLTLYVDALAGSIAVDVGLQRAIETQRRVFQEPSAQQMVNELHTAVYGDTWARPESPRAVWRKLLSVIENNRSTRDAPSAEHPGGSVCADKRDAVGE